MTVNSENPNQIDRTYEDQKLEYQSLRQEILQADNMCRLITFALITAVIFLYNSELQWLISFVSFIALCYLTEKRFMIKHINNYFTSNGSYANFKWDIEYISKQRNSGTLRPFDFLRPSYVEIFLCLLISLISVIPVFFFGFNNIYKLFNVTNLDDIRVVFSIVFMFLTCILSIVGVYKYEKLKA